MPSTSKQPLSDEDSIKTKTPVVFNPCACWSLKDGCIVTGIWTVICAALQVIVFGWQTSVIREERFRASNARATWYGTLSRYDRKYPAYYEQYYETPEERFFLQLFIIQIIHIISDVFLFGSGIALIWAIQRRVKFAFWPYYVTVITSILANIAYCGIWLASPARASDSQALTSSLSVRDRIPYWGVLTAIAILFSLVNAYAFIVLVAGHQHISKGILKTTGYRLEERQKPKTSTVSIYHEHPLDAQKPETKIVPEDIRKDDPTFGTPTGIRKPLDPNLAFQPPLGTYPYPPMTGGNQYPNFHHAASYPFYPYPGVSGPYPTPTPDPVPPYRPGLGVVGPKVSGATDTKNLFTQLWLSGVEPGPGPVDPAPIVLPPTQSVLGGGSAARRRSRRRRHGSRSSMRSRGSIRSRSRHRSSRNSESDTETSSEDYDTRSRTSVRTCDSCRRRLKYGDPDARQKHRGRKRHSSESSTSDTGYSDLTKSRTTAHRRSNSDSESFATTSYLDGTEVTKSSRTRASDRREAKRGERSGASKSDDDRARRKNRRDKQTKQPPTHPAKPATEVDPTGYASAPQLANRAPRPGAPFDPRSSQRRPLVGGAGGGALPTITIPITIPSSSAPRAANVDQSKRSYSDQSTLPSGGEGGSRTPPREYQVQSEVTIKYTGQDGRMVTSTTTNPQSATPSGSQPTTGGPQPGGPQPRVAKKPSGGVPLPGMTTPPPRPYTEAQNSGIQIGTQSAPAKPGGDLRSSEVKGQTSPDQLNNSSSSQGTRTYGTTAV